MQKAEVQVANPLGMHARLAFHFTRLCGGYKSAVRISYKDRNGSGKEIMDLLALGAGPDSYVVIETEGEDEAAALESLTRFLGAGERAG
ncbi:MAG: hypothetical protein IEMM0002_1109 [bacterium]|nr:MAG: hypothetical protein IEMM0002_1109 [bacterium]